MTGHCPQCMTPLAGPECCRCSWPHPIVLHMTDVTLCPLACRDGGTWGRIPARLPKPSERTS